MKTKNLVEQLILTLHSLKYNFYLLIHRQMFDELCLDETQTETGSKLRQADGSRTAKNTIPNFAKYFDETIDRVFPGRISYHLQKGLIKSVGMLAKLYQARKNFLDKDIDFLEMMINEKVKTMINNQQKKMNRLTSNGPCDLTGNIKSIQTILEFKQILIFVIREGTGSDAEIKDILQRLFDCEIQDIGKDGRKKIQANKIIKSWRYILNHINLPPPEILQFQIPHHQPPPSPPPSPPSPPPSPPSPPSPPTFSQIGIQVEEWMKDDDISILIHEPTDPQVLKMAEFFQRQQEEEFKILAVKNRSQPYRQKSNKYY